MSDGQDIPEEFVRRDVPLQTRMILKAKRNQYMSESQDKHRTANKFAKFFLRSSRGQGLVDRLMTPIKDVLNGAVYLFAIKGLTGYTIDYFWIPIIVIGIKITEPLIAWADERWGFWKAENYYSAYELNPFNHELLSRIKNIEDKLK